MSSSLETGNMNKNSPPRSRLGNAAYKVGGAVTGAAKGGYKVVHSVWDDFRNFIDKGNVVDLAVGIVIGASFTAIVNSFVKDLITPILSLATGTQLENSFVYLKKSQACSLPVNNCTTPAAAQALGSVTWNWGNFVQITINFLLTALILFFLVKAYAAGFRRKAPPKKEKDCEACCKSIPIKAMRCPFCTTPVSMPLPAAPSVVTPAAPTSEMYQQQVKRNDSSNTVDAMGGGGGSRDYISQYKMN